MLSTVVFIVLYLYYLLCSTCRANALSRWNPTVDTAVDTAGSVNSPLSPGFKDKSVAEAQADLDEAIADLKVGRYI